MDVMKAIRELREELARVDAMIAVLEERARSEKRGGAAPPRRGRKRMSREERLVVSERMRKYWADRKTDPSPPSKRTMPPAS